MKKLLLFLYFLTSFNMFGSDICLCPEQNSETKMYALSAFNFSIATFLCINALYFFNQLVKTGLQEKKMFAEVKVLNIMSKETNARTLIIQDSNIELVSIYNRLNPLTKEHISYHQDVSTSSQGLAQFEQRAMLRNIDKNDQCCICLSPVSELGDSIMQLGCCGQVACKQDLLSLQERPCPNCRKDILVVRPVKRSFERAISTSDLTVLSSSNTRSLERVLGNT